MGVDALASGRNHQVRLVLLLAVGGVLLSCGGRARPEGADKMNHSSSSEPQVPAELRLGILQRTLFVKDARNPADALRCVLMDWGMDKGTATLVAFDDGTTSLYMNQGGGYLGMGGHESVKRAATVFREEAARALGGLKATSDFSLPGAGSVAFFVVTESGTFGSGPIQLSVLKGGHHALSRLGKLGNDVITEVRLVAENLATQRKK